MCPSLGKLLFWKGRWAHCWDKTSIQVGNESFCYYKTRFCPCLHLHFGVRKFRESFGCSGDKSATVPAPFFLGLLTSREKSGTLIRSLSCQSVCHDHLFAIAIDSCRTFYVCVCVFFFINLRKPWILPGWKLNVDIQVISYIHS